jgi:YHS domain-containing protein/putative intracellular protease/amidase
MNRRTFFTATAALAAMRQSLAGQAPPVARKLTPPANGEVPVAFLISEGAVVIDFAGPWEVFQDTIVPKDKDNVPGFHVYTVSGNTQPVAASGGMRIIPDYSFENAPPPKVIVIPAQNGSPAMLDWIRKASQPADLTMSVCTGAFLLAQTGLLAGKAATTHHGSYGNFAMQYRNIQLKRGYRFVEAGDHLATAGGLTSGIDLALRVVERYYGRFIAERTAFYMEYQGTGWMDSTGASNAAYAVKSKGGGLSDPVCGMAVSSSADLQSTYKGTTYHFCSVGCQDRFDQAPSEYVAE